ncbi:hypothetical protein [Massilia sp. TWP1-3-3]|uniref:hypothetical protein n=1 Tax=Massilia sp. TWP1-3-3 TaxID=2804573 RepID=UPI003CF3368B
MATVISGACLVLVCPLVSAATGNTVQQAMNKSAATQALAAAQRDLAQFVAHQLARRGAAPGDFPLAVTDMQALKDARIAYGFSVYTIDPSDLLAGRNTMRGMARQVNEWRFVVTLNQQAIGLATVEKNNGRYETVAYGAAVLAKDLDAAAGRFGNTTSPICVSCAFTRRVRTSWKWTARTVADALHRCTRRASR